MQSTVEETKTSIRRFFTGHNFYQKRKMTGIKRPKDAYTIISSNEQEIEREGRRERKRERERERERTSTLGRQTLILTFNYLQHKNLILTLEIFLKNVMLFPF
jgi:hypothetical protein